MANIKSAKKRISVNERQKQENKFVKATVNTYIKKYRKAIAEQNLETAETLLKETISLITSAQSKGVFHKNNASRKVARLSHALYKAQSNTAKEEVAPVAKEEEVAVVAPVAEVEAPVKKTTRKPAAKKAEASEEVAVAPKKTRTKKAE